MVNHQLFEVKLVAVHQFAPAIIPTKCQTSALSERRNSWLNGKIQMEYELRGVGKLTMEIQGIKQTMKLQNQGNPKEIGELPN